MEPSVKDFTTSDQKHTRNDTEGKGNDREISNN